MILACASSVPADDASVLLQNREQIGSLTRVQTVVELAGDLKLNPDGKQMTKLPLKGMGELVYDERVVEWSGPQDPRTDVRHYQKAEARFAVGQGEIVAKLGPERQLVGVKTTASQSTVFSPLGPLTRDELELIDVQASSVLFSRLLPDRTVKIGETWSPTDETAAMLLRLDVVTENKLESKLIKVDGKTAAIEMSGPVGGSVGGVASDIEVTAKYNFDLKLQRITWLAMSIHENRAVGHAEPGFDLTARVRVSVSPLASSTELADDIVTTLPLTGDETATYLTHATADGSFRLVHPRSWRMMIDRHDATVMRFVDRGEMIAQCNLSRLTDAAPDKLLTMESFQLDIQRSLAKTFGQFVEAKQFKTDRGLRALRVVVAGQASDLPIQWIYYHFTDEHGWQAAMVFTMDGNAVERFGGEDQSLVSALELLPAPAPKPKATTAQTPSAESAKSQKR